MFIIPLGTIVHMWPTKGVELSLTFAEHYKNTKVLVLGAKRLCNTDRMEIFYLNLVCRSYLLVKNGFNMKKKYIFLASEKTSHTQMKEQSCKPRSCNTPSKIQSS